MNDHDQLYLDSALQPPPDPVRTPELDQRISAWLDARRGKVDAGTTFKDAEHAMIVDMLAAGRERYPYEDPKTGKLRYFVADKTPKAKTIACVSREDKPRRGRRGRDKDVQIGDEVTADHAPTASAQPDNVIEMRRVSRASVAAEIDPFGATRTAMAAETAAAPGETDDDIPVPDGPAPKAKRKRTKKGN